MRNIFLVAFVVLLAGCVREQGQNGGVFLGIGGKKVLMAVAPDNFRDEELFHTQEELEKAGAEITIASSRTGAIRGSQGGTAEAKILLKDVSPRDYDAVVFVGGSGASVYFGDAAAHSLAREMYSAGKVVGAICIAPVILANAGLLEGKNAACFSGEKNSIEAKGANYTGQGVTIDGKIITADGPGSARQFGKKIAELLSQVNGP